MSTPWSDLVESLTVRARKVLEQLGVHSTAELLRIRGLALQPIDQPTLNEILAVRTLLAASQPRTPTFRSPRPGHQPGTSTDQPAPLSMTGPSGKNICGALGEPDTDPVDKLRSLSQDQAPGQDSSPETCRIENHATGTETAGNDDSPVRGPDSIDQAIALDEVLPFLNPRARRVLSALGVETFDQFARISGTDVLSVAQAGRVTWEHLRDVQDLFGVKPPTATEPVEDGARGPTLHEAAPSWEQLLDTLGNQARQALDTLDVKTLDALRGLTRTQVLSLPGAGQAVWEEIAGLLGRISPVIREAPAAAPHPLSLPFTEDALRLTPLFTDCPDSRWLTSAGHKSWRLNVSTSRLPLTTRAIAVISQLGLSTIGQLLATRASLILSLNESGPIVWEAIQDAVRRFLAVRHTPAELRRDSSGPA